MKYILFLIFILIFIWLKKNHIKVHFKTFGRKGFKKVNDVFGTYTFIGFQGDGKTYSVVDFINDIRSNIIDCKVITNVKSYYENNKDFAIYNDDLMSIIEDFKAGFYPENTIIFFDELFSMVNQGKLPKKVLTFISQFRKRHIYFLTTAQQWLDIPISFRRQSKYIIDCNMFNVFGRAFIVNQIQDGKKIKWSQIDNEYVAPVIRTSIKKCSKKLADSYDTLEVIEDK